MSYFSYLVCYHPGHTDIYITGVPVGVIKDGIFLPHRFKMPNGDSRQVCIEDFPQDSFKNEEDLKMFLNNVVSTIRLINRGN